MRGRRKADPCRLCCRTSCWTSWTGSWKDGHRFARYADDCNIYVRSRRAGERVMASVSQFIVVKLKLKVNSEKSAVADLGIESFWDSASAGIGSRNGASPGRQRSGLSKESGN